MMFIKPSTLTIKVMAPWVRGQIQVLGNDHILDICMERLKYITFQTYQVHFYVGKSKKKKSKQNQWQSLVIILSKKSFLVITLLICYFKFYSQSSYIWSRSSLTFEQLSVLSCKLVALIMFILHGINAYLNVFIYKWK